MFSSNTNTHTCIHTVSLHDALPICSYASERDRCVLQNSHGWQGYRSWTQHGDKPGFRVLCVRARGVQPLPRIPVPEYGRYLARSEEHTSELQSPCNIV